VKLEISILYDSDSDEPSVRFSWNRVDANPNNEGCRTSEFKDALHRCIDRIEQRELDAMNGIPFDTEKRERAVLKSINDLYPEKTT